MSDPKDVLIALAVMVPLFSVAAIGLVNTTNDSKTSAIEHITPVGNSFEKWVTENPEKVDSVYDKDMMFSEFAAMVDNDASFKDMKVKVTKLGEDDSRLCFSKTGSILNNKYLYSTLTDKTESVDKC